MTVSAPARIDLAGGTLDIPPLCFFVRDCLTLNLAVDLRVSVTAYPSTGGLLYSDRAEPRPIEEVPLLAEIHAYYQPHEIFDFHVRSHIPRASGLGGSSSLLVALAHLLGDHTGSEPRDNERLLGEVTVLEHRLLGKPAGTQDAIAAIYGGLNKITFDRAIPQRSALPIPDFLSGPLFLAYSHVQHHSGINNWSIIRAACDGDAVTRATLNELNRNSHRMLDALCTPDSGLFLECLHREARSRTKLSSTIRTEKMARFAEAFGEDLVCKVCGAGGGGCMFLFGEDLDPDALRHQAARFDLEILEVRADPRGCFEARS